MNTVDMFEGINAAFHRAAMSARPMTKTPKPKPTPDTLIDKLEHAITKILANPKATQKEKNDAIANGVKLAHIKFRISPESTEEFFGTEPE